MIVKKLFIAALLPALLPALLMTGCGGGAPPSGQPADNPANETRPDDSAPPDINCPEPQPPPGMLEGLIKDEYAGIEMSANVLERKAFLPGMAVPVTVVIENKGDKSVYYTQGSGSFKTPQALFLRSEDLQPVIPRDQLGIVTMDFVTKELKPGDILNFRLLVMAIKPSESFSDYTHDLFMDDIYIADMDWSELQERFPDLVAISPGNHIASVFFLYALPDEEGLENIFFGATGYAQADCIISIS